MRWRVMRRLKRRRRRMNCIWIVTRDMLVYSDRASCGLVERFRHANTFAENRPDTSQLQKAVNSGRGLP